MGTLGRGKKQSLKIVFIDSCEIEGNLSNELIVLKSRKESKVGEFIV